MKKPHWLRGTQSLLWRCPSPWEAEAWAPPTPAGLSACQDLVPWPHSNSLNFTGGVCFRAPWLLLKIKPSRSRNKTRGSFSVSHSPCCCWINFWMQKRKCHLYATKPPDPRLFSFEISQCTHSPFPCLLSEQTERATPAQLVSIHPERTGEGPSFSCSCVLSSSLSSHSSCRRWCGGRRARDWPTDWRQQVPVSCLWLRGVTWLSGSSLWLFSSDPMCIIQRLLWGPPAVQPPGLAAFQPILFLLELVCSAPLLI